ncbi:MAG: YbaN family protein [Anaerolineae bacterium]|nr:YbaN family protein [Anaerolineae bacterium]
MSLRKWLLIAIGIASLSLGLTGIFIPLLPTTPFLLLAAACFFHSSERLHVWLIHHRWLGDYIRHYREHRAITLGAKITTLCLLWGVIGYTAFDIVTLWWVRALLGIIAAGVTIHILSLKTLTRKMLIQLQTNPKTEYESQGG